MSNHFIVPTFNKATPSKVHNKITVAGQNTISLSTTSGNYVSAISTESIPATVDGEYVFAVRVDNIGSVQAIMIGVTSTERFDSDEFSRPGCYGMSGCALNLYNGIYTPNGSSSLVDYKITNKVEEVIVVVTIANNGAQKLIRCIVNGTSTVNHDFAGDCYGKKLFVVVTLHKNPGDHENSFFSIFSSLWQHVKITTIPIDQITIRNDEVNKLIAKCAMQSSTNQGAVANNNQRQQPSAADFAQLQQELEKERKRADLAEAQLRSNEKQLQQEKQRANACETQLQHKDQQLLDEKSNAAILMTEVKQKDQQLQQKDQEIQNEKKMSASLTMQVQQKDQQLFDEKSNAANLIAEVKQKDQEIQNEKKMSASLTMQVQQKDQQLLDEKKNAANLIAEVKQKDQQLQQKDQQLQQKDSEIDQLKQQLLTLQSQLNNNNNSLAPSSPFVKDKLYQIDFAVNGITPPADPNAFGTLLKLPSQNNSLLFQHVKNEMWKKLGTFLPSPAPVNHFTLESVEVLHQSYAGFEDRIRRLQLLRTQNGNFFNPPTGAFTAEQLQILISLRDQFLPRPSNADPKSPNLINVFHGTRVDRLHSVVNGLVAVRSTDAGYFGSGVYTTTSIEYAAKYAKGDFDFKNGPYPPRASDGCIPVVWCVAAVGVCYPLTREVDYSKKRVHDGMDVSDFFGAPLTPGYDCHCVAVNESVGFQAVPRKDMQYMEVVFDQEVQVLPIAVLWVKSM